VEALHADARGGAPSWCLMVAFWDGSTCGIRS
jgi:hypothetical protein